MCALPDRKHQQVHGKIPYVLENLLMRDARLDKSLWTANLSVVLCGHPFKDRIELRLDFVQPVRLSLIFRMNDVQYIDLRLEGIRNSGRIGCRLSRDGRQISGVKDAVERRSVGIEGWYMRTNGERRLIGGAQNSLRDRSDNSTF